MRTQIRLVAAVVVLAVAAALPACGDDENESQPEPTFADTAYGRDVDRICHAEQRSGALAEDESMRMIVVAKWLAGQIESDQGRSFLGRLRQAEPAEKSEMLRAVAREHGLDDCPTADTWGR